ncbi:MAG: hypothetical protein QM796_04685 [Chthoniobacteraceae bacterium]
MEITRPFPTSVFTEGGLARLDISAQHGAALEGHGGPAVRDHFLLPQNAIELDILPDNPKRALREFAMRTVEDGSPLGRELFHRRLEHGIVAEIVERIVRNREVLIACQHPATT